DGLPAAGFADHPYGLAAHDLEIDAVDGLHHAIVGREMGLQPADVEQRIAGWRGGVHRTRHMTLRGSSTSRRPSPMKLIESTVRKIAAPAKSAQCGAKSR